QRIVLFHISKSFCAVVEDDVIRMQFYLIGMAGRKLSALSGYRPNAVPAVYDLDVFDICSVFRRASVSGGFFRRGDVPEFEIDIRLRLTGGFHGNRKVRLLIQSADIVRGPPLR